MVNKNAKLGKLGEQEAAVFLEALGYQILFRNWRSGQDEIDLIAMHKDWLIFIEVKTRSGTAFGQPWQFVDKRKRNALNRAANKFIVQNKVDCNVRFDIVSILISANQQMHIELIENAFIP